MTTTVSGREVVDYLKRTGWTAPESAYNPRPSLIGKDYAQQRDHNETPLGVFIGLRNALGVMAIMALLIAAVWGVARWL